MNNKQTKSFKPSGRLNSIFLWPVGLGILLVLLDILLCFVSSVAASIVAVFIVIYAFVCAMMICYFRPRIIKEIVEFSSNYSQVQRQLLYELSIPYCLLDNKGNILWMNASMQASINRKNDLNKNMTYFQMPVKFSKSEGNGELYVFTNKKNLAGKTDNISAMLHLDMDNLKSMDIYVNLSGGNNVSTNFVLETEELLDFVYQHIDRLNARLEKLGYNTHFEMKVAADSSDRLDFVKDFIEAEARPAAGGQYIFDAKA